MGKRILIAVAIVIVALVGYFSWHTRPTFTPQAPQGATTNNISCNIGSIDLANYSIATDQFGELHFKNGEFLEKDDLGNSDWSFKISSSSLYKLGSDSVRVINVYADHLNGSGSWNIALGYGCTSNGAKKVLEQASVGEMKIEKVGETTLKLTWQEGYQGASVPQKTLSKVVNWDSPQKDFAEVK